MRLRGYIKKGESIHLTCCEKQTDIQINDKSLYRILDDEFNLDPEIAFEGESQDDPLIGVSYLILDEDPGDGDFEDIIGEWITKKLYSEHINGCYSEYTCGYGGFDYFIDGGHNIFSELLSYKDKYILLDIRDIRELQINEIIKED